MAAKLFAALISITILLTAAGVVFHPHNAGAAAVLETDSDEVTLGQDLTIILAEPDANFNSRSIDRISLGTILISTDKFDETPLDQVLEAIAKIASSKDRSPIQTNHPFLRETDFNSGIFEVTLRSINDLLVGRDKDIRITYLDSSGSGGGSVVRVEKVVHVGKASISIKFNKKQYAPFDTVQVLLTAQMFNVNRDRVDAINAPSEEGGRLAVTTSSGETYYPSFFETGINTGTFTGTFKLTRDPVEMEGDLVVKNGDRMRVEVRIVGGFEISDSAVVASRMATISFDGAGYAAGGEASVAVIDPDENKDPEIVDSVPVSIWSGTYMEESIELVLRETGPDTGIFEASIVLAEEVVSSGSGSEAPSLQVSESDIVFARYYDRTVPSPIDSDGEYVVASANVGGLPAHVEILLSAPLLLDPEGNQLQRLEVGRMAAIQSTITNPGTEMKPFTYITHVEDGEGLTVQLGFVKGMLEPVQSLKVARSWIPDLGGEYTIRIVVWDELDEPSVLSPEKKLTVDVSE